jgi:hypothetical protein
MTADKPWTTHSLSHWKARKDGVVLEISDFSAGSSRRLHDNLFIPYERLMYILAEVELAREKSAQDPLY